MKDKVVIGLSGGVDSSVSAYLLKEQGFEVIAITLLTNGNNVHEKQKELEDAKKVAEALDISHQYVDFRNEFKSTVQEYFIDEYINGRTPNPCMICNYKIKWKALLEKANELSAKYIATGHYAHIKKLDNGRHSILMAKEAEKDQAYVLFGLNQEQLGRTIMPLGDYNKDDVRNIARKANIPVANKPDSQDICFISDGDYVNYIKHNCKSDTEFSFGDFVDTKGVVVGRHNGIINYTVGQRKGLGISFGEPMYVVAINKEENQIVLGRHNELFSNKLIVENINYVGVENFEELVETPMIAKIRYKHSGSNCVVKYENNNIVCIFEEEQRAITSGQGIVFYHKENKHILAGGIIAIYK